MLFREYAKAFKGARQLTYSSNLRARYKVDEIVNLLLEPVYGVKVFSEPYNGAVVNVYFS